MNTIRWGVLSTAKIGRIHVIPALQSSAHNQVVAIASRNLAQAESTAAELGITKAYGSYEELLSDPTIDAIYNPLPNNLHVDWSLKILAAGKHLLCEKPLGMNAADAQRLAAAASAQPQLKAMEAFMYRFHPQWQTLKQWVVDGKIGQVRSIHSHFAYNNRDQHNIRNLKETGGGALMDIGCYCISLARWIFATEPQAVLGQITPVDGYEVDCLTSGILTFPAGTASFTASTKIEPRQYVEICGEQGNILLPLPFNPVGDTETDILLIRNAQTERTTLAASNHYRNMCDAFALSIINNTEVPTPLQDAIANMRVIDAVFASAAANQWINI